MTLASLLEHHLLTIAGIVAALVGIITAAPTLRRAWRNARRLAGAIWETNIGRPAEPPNPLTGAPARPEIPAIGARMTRVEQATSRTTELQERTNELQEQGNDLMQQVIELIRGQQHQDTRLDDHETRIETLETAAVERAVTRAESLTHLAMLAKAQGLDLDELAFTPDADPDPEPES